jgi:hypothetical protein
MPKPCKSCKEQIDEAATKCPKCQAYQQCYRNPQYVSLLFLPFVIVFLFWNTSHLRHLTDHPTFSAYQDKLNVSIVREDPDGSSIGKKRLLTVKLDNRSDKTWKRPKFQVESLDAEGKVLSAEHLSEYNLVVAPNSSVLTTLSLRVVPAEAVANRKVSLTDIESNLF